MYTIIVLLILFFTKATPALLLFLSSSVSLGVVFAEDRVGLKAKQEWGGLKNVPTGTFDGFEYARSARVDRHLLKQTAAESAVLSATGTQRRGRESCFERLHHRQPHIYI